MEFILNDRTIKTDKPGGMTLLDFVRYENQLMGTKIGCREGDCGACTVLIGELEHGKMRYESMTSCIMPLSNAVKRHVVTIEGLNMNGLSPVQKAFIECGGTQCGFCTVGFIVSLTGYCFDSKKASYEYGVSAIDGNICRCTGYKSIERATASVVEQLKEKNLADPIAWLVKAQFIPEYFLKIPLRLGTMGKTKVGANGQNGRDGKELVGGGTDLYVQRPEELMGGEVNDFFNRSDLKVITVKENRCSIGAAATVTDLMESAVFREQFPSLRKYFKLISSTQIRNMGTVAGNFVNASPIGDLTIFFLALNSSLTLCTSNGEKRDILLRNFYKGYKTLDKYKDEYIESIHFDLFDKNTQFNFEKVSKRTNLDIASANTAARIKVDDNTILEMYASAGGVGPIPLYLEKTCAFLKGKELTPDTVSDAVEIMEGEISPISDARGTKEYKALLLRQLFYAHFIELFPEKFEMEKWV